MRRLLAYTNHIVPSLLALAVCLFSGCQKSATQKVTDDLGNDYISFSGETSDGYAVKSEDGSTPKLATTDILKTKSFGIFGGKSYDGETNFSSVFQTDRAQVVEWKKEGTTEKWTYEPKQKWERAMHYRFRAVWPYKPENIQTGSSANCLSVTYSSFEEDYDLMVAYATRWPLQDGVDPVTLSFKHALAGLRFKIKFAEDITESDNLTDFYITGIYPKGQLFYGFGLDASVTKDGEGEWKLKGVALKGKTFDDFRTTAQTLTVDELAFVESTTKGSFFMTNAPLYTNPGGVTDPSGGNAVTLTKINTENIYSTQAEAEDNPAASIYVERAVAKVSASS